PSPPVPPGTNANCPENLSFMPFPQSLLATFWRKESAECVDPASAFLNAQKPGCRSGGLDLHRWTQRDGGLGGEQQERKRLLQIQANGGIRVAGIANGDVLADVEV